MECPFLKDKENPRCGAVCGEPSLTADITDVFCLAERHGRCPRFLETTDTALESGGVRPRALGRLSVRA